MSFGTDYSYDNTSIIMGQGTTSHPYTIERMNALILKDEWYGGYVKTQGTLYSNQRLIGNRSLLQVRFYSRELTDNDVLENIAKFVMPGDPITNRHYEPALIERLRETNREIQDSIKYDIVDYEICCDSDYVRITIGNARTEARGKKYYVKIFSK